MSRPLPLAAASATLLASALVLGSCGGGAASSPPPVTTAPPTEVTPAAVPEKKPVILSIVGTNDLHGSINRLPILAGYVTNLRKVRQADGGAVLLLDGGDMFQGTLESNIAEGADVIAAYNAMGYTAAAVGNHEFDFGPVGPAVTISAPTEDARGALKARAAEAKFPLLTANIVEESGERPRWPNVLPSTKITVAGVTVGIIGLSTDSTPYTTMPVNFLGLKMALPTAAAAVTEANVLRSQGATVVLIAAHIGSSCRDLENPDDLSSCRQDDELFQVLRDVPAGLIDAWVGGHTHSVMAHRVNGVAVIESYANGRAFGRIDLHVGADGKVLRSDIHKPRFLCQMGPNNTQLPVEQCAPGPYEGAPVVPDAEIAKIVTAAYERTRAQRDEKLGVTATATITRSYREESALGNWFTDMMLASRKDAQIALANGGGLRADVPAGDITYGQLFEAIPFDNRFALIKLTGAQVLEMITQNLTRDGALYSWGGLTVSAFCKRDQLAIDVRVGGKPLDNKKTYTMVTSDFLASGGDGTLSKLGLPPSATNITLTIMRDAFADVLRAKRGAAKKIDPVTLHDPKAPRQRFTGPRPLSCGATPAPAAKPAPSAGN